MVINDTERKDRILCPGREITAFKNHRGRNILRMGYGHTVKGLKWTKSCH